MTVLIQSLAGVRDRLSENARHSCRHLRTNKECKLTKRLVRFAVDPPQVVCYVTALKDMTPEEKEETWWSPAAMKEISRDAKILGKEAQSSTFIAVAFEKAFDKSKSMVSKSAAGNNSAAFEQVEVDQELVDYCRFGHSWRGLERSSSSKHLVQARFSASSQAKEIVFRMTSQGADAPSIGQVYERVTRSAKLFARYMGEADAIACKERFVKKRRSTTASDINVVAAAAAAVQISH